MTDENTVEAIGPVADESHTKTIYSVLRYSSQCPECGAMPSNLNEWCDLCYSQIHNIETQFDGVAALKALFDGSGIEDDEEEEVEDEEEEENA